MTCPLAHYVAAEVYTEAETGAACLLAEARDLLIELLDAGTATPADFLAWDTLCEDIKTRHRWSTVLFLCGTHTPHSATPSWPSPPTAGTGGGR